MTRNKKILAIALAGAAFLAPVAHAQDTAESSPVTSSNHPRQGDHRDEWQQLARNAAAEVMTSLGRYARVTVTAPEGDSAFERALHEMVVSELNAKDAFVTQQGPHVRRVKLKVTTSAPRMVRRVEHDSLDAALHKAGRTLGLVSGSRLPAPMVMDVTVTTTVKDGGVFLARRTEVFEVRGADIALYKQPAQPLSVVGDTK